MSSSKAEMVTIPQLIGDKLYLRPLTAQDISKSYHWYLQSDPHALSAQPARILTATSAGEAFKQEAATDAQQSFAIVRKADEQMVGQIRYYNVNPLNHSAELFVLIDPDERRKGLAKAAVRLLSRYLFRYRDINKVYFSASDLNTAAMKLAETLHFQRDATLRHHLFYNGEYHDQYIYSLLRFEFSD
ncbi:MAG: N-acetyltransferase [Candidatus Zixiibacteriota bacterium]|nr:MAG: N-acetyltransferase [candidate division Zixibacteria bacterium]